MSFDIAGTTEPAGVGSLGVDSSVRINSNTKPMAAALALSLAEAGLLVLDRPGGAACPQAGRSRVLRRLDGHLVDTVPTQ